MYDCSSGAGSWLCGPFLLQIQAIYSPSCYFFVTGLADDRDNYGDKIGVSPTVLPGICRFDALSAILLLQNIFMTGIVYDSMW